MLEPISRDELRDMSLPDIVRRMDEILVVAEEQRHGPIPNEFPVPVVSDIINTKKARALPQDAIRALAHIAFSYRVQLELDSIAAGIANRVLFTPDFNNETSWFSPVFRLRHGALRQYEIVSSRMAMEIFMDLLYFIDTGGRLEAKRSKLKKFRTWLCDSSNPFNYFAHILLEAYRFDRGLRTPEIHGTPALPRELLTLQIPSHQDLNESTRLHSALVNCWRPLIQILDEERPNYMGISADQMAWFDAYMRGTDQEIDEQLTTMFDALE
jgi:hypothetical protein